MIERETRVTYSAKHINPSVKYFNEKTREILLCKIHKYGVN
jgi:hypothetical protein